MFTTTIITVINTVIQYTIDLGHFTDPRDRELLKKGLSAARTAVTSTRELYYSFEIFPGLLFNWMIDIYLKLYSTSKCFVLLDIMKLFFFSMLLLIILLLFYYSYYYFYYDFYYYYIYIYC